MSGSVAGTPNATTGYLVSDLVGLALRQIGVGVAGATPSANDMADGVMHLNMMLAQWQRRRWLVPTLVDIAAVSTGAATLLAGPSQDFDVTARPDKLEAAYARYLGFSGAATSTVGDFSADDFSSTDFDTGTDVLNNTAALAYDFPLGLIESREDYSSIRIKNLSTWPVMAFYSPEFPYGTLNVWPIPQAGVWEIHIICKQVLQTDLTASSPINLPPEYDDAIMWALAARLAPAYGQEAGATVSAMARSALNTIRTANVQIPGMALPNTLQGGFRRGGYGFNYWSGLA